MSPSRSVYIIADRVVGLILERYGASMGASAPGGAVEAQPECKLESQPESAKIRARSGWFMLQTWQANPERGPDCE
jgi:hypothetical protein